MVPVQGAAALLLSLAALIAACDSTDPNDDEWMAPEEALSEIREHVDVFLDEAEARGRTPYLYKASELQIVVDDSVDFQGESVCGYGAAVGESERPTIYLAINRNCWDRTRWDHEILVFHELGHALLGRGHRDDDLPNGLRASIMNGGNIFGLYSELRAEHRDYYVDELFDVNTPAPVWGY